MDTTLAAPTPLHRRLWDRLVAPWAEIAELRDRAITDTAELRRITQMLRESMARERHAREALDAFRASHNFAVVVRLAHDVDVARNERDYWMAEADALRARLAIDGEEVDQ
jgi:hypothetical protein